MKVVLRQDIDPGVRADTLAREKAYSQDLQRGGDWVHMWRLVGQYSNLSTPDVRDNEKLREILWNLPLFSSMTIKVTPLAQHPSDITWRSPKSESSPEIGQDI